MRVQAFRGLPMLEKRMQMLRLKGRLSATVEEFSVDMTRGAEALAKRSQPNKNDDRDKDLQSVRVWIL